MRRGHIEIRAVKGRTVRVKKIVHLQPLSLRAWQQEPTRYAALRVSWEVELLGFDNWFPFFEEPGYDEGAVPDYREVDHFDAMFEEAASLLVELPETQKEQP